MALDPGSRLLPRPSSTTAVSGRRCPKTSIFQTGCSYEIKKQTDSTLDVVASFSEFHKIMKSIPRSAYHIYTDGSRDVSSLNSGAAAIIRHGDTTIASCQEHTGQETVNYAELHAILLGLRWISQHHTDRQGQKFHFWTDSQYAFRLLTEQDTAKTHFFTVQEIFQLASHLHHSYGHYFTIHRISSHVALRVPVE